MLWDARHQGKQYIDLRGHGSALPLITCAFRVRWLASANAIQLQNQFVTPVYSSHTCVNINISYGYIKVKYSGNGHQTFGTLLISSDFTLVMFCRCVNWYHYFLSMYMSPSSRTFIPMYPRYLFDFVFHAAFTWGCRLYAADDTRRGPTTHWTSAA